MVVGTVYAVDKLNEASRIIPDLQDRMAAIITTPSQIISSDGVTLRQIATDYRRPITIEKVPQTVIDATLAAEDVRFYNHGGVDLIAMGRVAFEALSRKRQTGGSTITMQLAKRVFTSSEKSMDRKMKDMALAAMIEKQLTKDQILELYLNQVFYGESAFGISAAADVYFGKTLDQLTVAEAALLARCVRRPSDENPFNDLRKAIENRNVVLKLMRDENMITQEQYDQAREEEVKLRKDRPRTVSGIKSAPYFVDFVENIVKKDLGIDLSTGGYTVETTLNYEAQKIADEGVKSGVRRYKGLRVNDGAFVLLDNEGRILAMVGGKDYNTNQFNKAAQGGRQPGSSFKPIVYATAFERGTLSPGGSVNNATALVDMGGGRKKSVRGGGAMGYVPVSLAMANSYNRAATHAIQEVGPYQVVDYARNNLGFKSKLQAVDSLALGASDVTPLEMAQAYSTFQNHGSRVTAFAITRITDPTGKVVYPEGGDSVQPRFHSNAMAAANAEGMDTILRRVVTSGTGRRASGVTNARGKTGTTSDNKDAWFCGYTDKYIAVMWIGNPKLVKQKNGTFRAEYDEMSSAAEGGKVSCPIWADIMKQIQAKFGEKRRNLPNSLGYDRDRKPDEAPDEPQEEPEEVRPTTEDVVPSTTTDPVVPNDPIPTQTNPPVQADPPATTGGGSGGTTGGESRTSGGGGTEASRVSVEICADSGSRASLYCPERVTRQYRAGHEPRGVCKIHGRG